MGPRAEAPVVPVIPVDVVMAALVTGHRPVRNLFPLVTIGLEHLTDQVVGVGGLVFIGVTRRVLAERGGRLRGEGVTGDVGRTMLE